ncbi:MAG TPA: co-chaperone GroES [Actinomycetota bacterium]
MEVADKFSLKPLEDRVVVRAIEEEETTASGLVIPDTAKEKPTEGEVIAVGPGKFDDAGKARIPMEVKAGDRVIFSKYGGTEVKVAGEEYMILQSRDIYAVIDK